MRETVVLVMSDAGERRSLLDVFSELGWRVRVAGGDGDEAGRACEESGAKLAVVEWAQGAEDVSEGVVSRMRARTRAPIVAAAADPAAEEVVHAVKAGAADFLVLDVAGPGLRESLERLIQIHVGLETDEPASPIEARVVGSSRAARLMRSRLHGLATLSGPVLVIGESGTGRDTVARALHEAGATPRAPFRRIDCPRWRPGEALPGAGTLYLDHVDRLSAAGQQYFAHRMRQMKHEGWERGPRVVASAGPAFASARGGSSIRGGSSAHGESNVRGGSNGAGDGRAVAAEEFDAGLFDELMRFPLELVPLRERLEDVPEIADRIVGRLGAHMRREVRLSADAHAFLARQGWPGNVQQLARLLERGVAFCASGSIDGATMEQLVDDFEESLAAIRRNREVAERDELLETLARTGGNISRCAEVMGRSRGAIYRLIEKYGIALPKAMRKRPPRSRDAEAAG